MTKTSATDLILTVRTDNPDAEIGLYTGNEQVAYETWYAHRELSTTLLTKIEALLSAQGKTIHDITAIIGYAGPGSFTGLRIGLAVVNALAYSLQIPVAGISHSPEWIQEGVARLQRGEHDPVIQPLYGAPVHITQQKK